MLLLFLNLYPTATLSPLGWGFSIVFAVMSLFSGRLCDSSVGRTLHVIAVVLWSGATIFQAGCGSFICLLFMRVIVGVGQAFNAPACYRAIACHFQESDRPTANGIYSAGTYAGAALASACAWLSAFIGWRFTTMFSGLIGLFIAYTLWNVLELPPHPHGSATLKDRGSDNETLPLDVPTDDESSLKYNVSRCDDGSMRIRAVKQDFQPVLFLLLIIATSIRMVSTWVAASYLPIYFDRAFHDRLSDFQLWYAVLLTVGGSFSSMVGGMISSRWNRAYPGGGRVALFPAITSLIAIIPLAITLYTSDFNLSIVALAVQLLLAECWLGPGMALLQDSISANTLGQGVAITLFWNTLVASLGPIVVALNDPGTSAIRGIIFFVIGGSYIFSAVVFGLISLLGSTPRSVLHRIFFRIFKLCCIPVEHVKQMSPDGYMTL